MKYNDRNTQRINKSYQDKNKSELNNITDRSIKRFNKRLYKINTKTVFLYLKSISLITLRGIDSVHL